MKRFSVYEGFMPQLLQKCNKIKNKCKKLGCEFHFEQIGEEIREIQCPDKIKRNFKFIVVEVEGTAKLNDWEFVSTIEHTEKGNIFKKALTNIEIPERYRDEAPICEHCHSNRYRKDTYIVRNINTGEFKQVGKSCLKDFTNGMSVSDVTFYLSIKDMFEEYESKPINSTGFKESYFDTKELLQFAAETIKHFGYIKTKDYDGYYNPHATKYKVEEFFAVSTGRTAFLNPKEIKEIQDTMDQVNFDPDSEDTIQTVELALSWIKEQEDTNDYIHNLKVITSLDYIKYSNLGVLISLIPTYFKAMSIETKRKEQENQDKKSSWVGQVGEKINVQVQSIDCVTSWDRSYNGYSNQTTYLYKIVDIDNNIYTWKTATVLENVSALSGTIKAHDNYNGTKQTALTRCKILSVA